MLTLFLTCIRAFKNWMHNSKDPEIRHIEGYLAWWDELRRRHPGLMIDSYASGGRRNDLESLLLGVGLAPCGYTSSD